jgi:hypothetical protein
MAIMDALAGAKKKIQAGNQETGNIGTELNQKVRMKRAGEEALDPGPSPKPAPKPEPVTSPKDKVNPSGQYGDRGSEKRIDTGGMTKPLGTFHKGGKVKKSGMYSLKKGEAVLTAQQQKSKRAQNVLGGGDPSPSSPAAGASPDEMTISKLDDGSFHIAHRSTKGKEPMGESKKFSAKNAKHLVRHVRSAYVGSAAEPDEDDNA